MRIGLILSLGLWFAAALTGCGILEDSCQVPEGCSESDCQSDVNQCGGAVYWCVDGELIEGHCDPSPADAGVDGAPADAATQADAEVTDGGGQDGEVIDGG